MNAFWSMVKQCGGRFGWDWGEIAEIMPLKNQYAPLRIILCYKWIELRCNERELKSFVYEACRAMPAPGAANITNGTIGPASRLGGSYVNYVSDALKLGKYKYKGELATGPSWDVKWVAPVGRFIQSANGFHQGHFRTESGSDTQAFGILHMAPSVMFFDPNFGEAAFPAKQFIPFFAQLLDRIYPNLTGSWEVMRVHL